MPDTSSGEAKEGHKFRSVAVYSHQCAYTAGTHHARYITFRYVTYSCRRPDAMDGWLMADASPTHCVKRRGNSKHASEAVSPYSLPFVYKRHLSYRHPGRWCGVYVLVIQMQKRIPAEHESTGINVDDVLVHTGIYQICVMCNTSPQGRKWQMFHWGGRILEKFLAAFLPRNKITLLCP